MFSKGGAKKAPHLAGLHAAGAEGGKKFFPEM